VKGENKIKSSINDLDKKGKLELNMTIQSPSRNQVTIPRSSNNSERVMIKTSAYILNINRLLKKIKSEISINFIQSDNKGLLLTTNKVAATLLQTSFSLYLHNW